GDVGFQLPFPPTIRVLQRQQMLAGTRGREHGAIGTRGAFLGESGGHVSRSVTKAANCCNAVWIPGGGQTRRRFRSACCTCSSAVCSVQCSAPDRSMRSAI